MSLTNSEWNLNQINKKKTLFQSCFPAFFPLHQLFTEKCLITEAQILPVGINFQTINEWDL